MVRFQYGSVPYVVHLHCRPVRWIGKLGITLGNHVFLAARGGEVTPELLAHEVMHVLQWRIYGVFGFAFRYLRDLALYGYGLKHPMEREAYDFAVSRVDAFRAAAAVCNGRA